MLGLTGGPGFTYHVDAIYAENLIAGGNALVLISGFIEISHASKSSSQDSGPSKSDGKNIVVNIVNINHEY